MPDGAHRAESTEGKEMTTRKTPETPATEPEQPVDPPVAPADPEEPVAANDPHTTPAPATTEAASEVSEYTLDDGNTYLLTAEEAKKRGAKASDQASNKAVKPSNK
jgi:hypothetical protein